MSVANNIAARTAATDAISLALELLAESGADGQRFWKLIGENAAGNCGMRLVPLVEPVNSTPMDDSEALAFEREVVPFGRWRGHLVADVPCTYWLALSEGDFSRKLKRWLQSDRFAKLQGESP